MDPSLTQPNPSVEEKENEGDTDGFVIPSLSDGDSDLSNQDVREPAYIKPPPKVIKEENIYLGPHGAPPSQAKQQQLDLSTAGRKQRFKQKLKEADHRYSYRWTQRENKVEHILELVGSKGCIKTSTTMMPKTSPRDWLDPHCHESQFGRYSH